MFYCAKWEHGDIGKQTFIECPHGKAVVIQGFEKFKFFIHHQLSFIGDERLCIISTFCIKSERSVSKVF